jgi:hypothetical protein
MCYGKDCKRCSKARECLGQVDRKGYKVLLSKAVPMPKAVPCKG